MGRYCRLEIRQRLTGRVRPVAPAQGRAGAAEFDACQIRQEAEGQSRRWERRYCLSLLIALTTHESRGPEDRLSNLPVAD